MIRESHLYFWDSQLLPEKGVRELRFFEGDKDKEGQSFDCEDIGVVVLSKQYWKDINCCPKCGHKPLIEKLLGEKVCPECEYIDRLERLPYHLASPFLGDAILWFMLEDGKPPLQVAIMALPYGRTGKIPVLWRATRPSLHVSNLTKLGIVVEWKKLAPYKQRELGFVFLQILLHGKVLREEAV